MRRWALGVAVGLGAAFLAAGCGTGGVAKGHPDVANGQKLFTGAAQCAACHTLSAAGSSGTIGPNLDQLKPKQATVVHQVTNGGAVMPAFKGKLTPAQIQKVTGSAFGAPSVTPAPPAFGQQPWGSHCTYSSHSAGHMAVDFIVYSDASPAEAKQTFQRLSLWFPPKSKPAIGDSAYLDSQGAIHVLRGKTRFYISVTPRNDKQVTDLAASVAAQM